MFLFSQNPRPFQVLDLDLDLQHVRHVDQICRVAKANLKPEFVLSVSSAMVLTENLG